MRRPRIGLFGGTFDPPHIGHLILASEAVQQLELSRLLWVLTPQPPHKEPAAITPVEHRLAMVNLAIADNSAFELSTLELDRPGPHYMIETVERLKAVASDSGIALLLGGDSVNDLQAWQRPRDLVAACDLIGAMLRPGVTLDIERLERVLPGVAAKIQILDVPLIDIASSEVRRRIRERLPFRYFLSTAVFKYIHEHGLYAP
jgi:nicotinate-nucleotide adenylyltransferase